jgi:hypothetical protein
LIRKRYREGQAKILNKVKVRNMERYRHTVDRKDITV